MKRRLRTTETGAIELAANGLPAVWIEEDSADGVERIIVLLPEGAEVEVLGTDSGLSCVAGRRGACATVAAVRTSPKPVAPLFDGPLPVP
ncbi:MAG: hypothetical protein DWQ35_00340 [Planctomycetota bacterium]|nr:MAG: hypothetical protein DWQ35_00340 [Planctomycetota bacterium]